MNRGGQTRSGESTKLSESGLVECTPLSGHIRLSASQQKTVKGELKMKAQTINDKSWKSYNNEPLHDGEILVPLLVNRDYAIARGADPANLRTWTKSGVRFLVMFVPVPVA